MTTTRLPRLPASLGLALAIALTALAAPAQEGGAASAVAGEAAVSRPAAPASDVPAFAAPPAGFDQVRAGIAHGRVETLRYESGVTGTQRSASVWLPADFSPTRRYPVLYLLHGIAGNQDEWRGYVHADTILDNLVADGQAVPMIVVMPNGRALHDDRPPLPDKRFTPEHVAAFERFEPDLLRFLIPAVDARYPTLADPRHRAIAGLSMGGGQALNIGLSHLDTFAWVGAFSAAPNTRPPSQLVPDAAARGRLALLYLSCGSRDGLIGVSQGVHRALQQEAVAHVWSVDDHGHDRDSWAPQLHEFARRLFR